MTTPDSITPAVNEMAKEQTPGLHGFMCRLTERHCLVCGKSARLLRPGDTVALRDLYPDRTDIEGVGTISNAYTSESGTTFVITLKHGMFLIPGSRLVPVRSAAT